MLYTHMLRAVLNIEWWQYIPNTDLYGNLLKVGDNVATKRMSLIGHCIRHPKLPVEKVLLWGEHMDTEEGEDSEALSWTP